MDIKGKYESKLNKTALSCDAFTTGYFVMGLLFFVPYAATAGGTLVMWFLPIACLIPFALLPLFYLLVHRVDMLLFGRYHLIMPVSAFVAALFFVMTFCVDRSSAAGACLIFFGFAVFVVAVSVYKYCSFSVRVRLDGDGGFTSQSKLYTAFSAFGGAAAVAVFIGFRLGGSMSVYLDTAYVLGAFNIAAALVQYLTSYYGIPRLCGKRVQSAKSVFRAFFTGLNKRVYFSALLFISAFAVIATLIVLFGFITAADVYIVVGIAAALFLFYAIADMLCKRLIKYRSFALSAFNFVCYFASCAMLIVVAATDMTIAARYALVLCAAAFCGAGGAITARQTTLRFATIKSRITSGMAYMLFELTALAAAAIALAVAAGVVTAGVRYAFIYAFAAGAAFAIAAFALAGKRPPHTVGAQNASYELVTSGAGEAQDVLPITAERDDGAL